MDFNKEWTEFALEAEYEQFGMKRIVEAHKRLMREVEALKYELREIRYSCSPIGEMWLNK
jgi:hypothetical protein